MYISPYIRVDLMCVYVVTARSSVVTLVVVVPLQVKVQVKRKHPCSSNLCCHLWVLHLSEALLWDPQQLIRRTRQSLQEGSKGGAAMMVIVPTGGEVICT